MLKKITSKVILGVLIVFLMSSFAMAQQTIFPSKTEIDFTEITLEGRVNKPAVDITIQHTEKSFQNLIKNRSNFEPAMIKSTNQLK